MSKPTDAWMPLYTGDYLRDTRHLTAEQHGCYLLWLMHYWNNGPLRNDLGALARIGCLESADATSIARALLDDFFYLAEDGLWHQRRVDHEKEKAVAKALSAKEKAAKAASVRWGVSNAPSSPSSSPSSISQALHEECPSQSPSQSPSDTQPPNPDFGNMKKTENQENNTPLEIEKQEPSPVLNSFELVGEGKKKSKKKSAKKDNGAEKDERFNRFQERFEAYFLYVSENRVKAPWDGREGAALKKWLAANPEITEKQWNTILHNRARSGFEQKVRLSSWIDLALSWLDGIADKWGNKPNGGNHAAISDGAGEKILGTVNGSLSGRQYQDYFGQDGDLQTSRKVGQGDVRTLHAGSSRP